MQRDNSPKPRMDLCSPDRGRNFRRVVFLGRYTAAN